MRQDRRASRSEPGALAPHDPRAPGVEKVASGKPSRARASRIPLLQIRARNPDQGAVANASRCPARNDAAGAATSHTQHSKSEEGPGSRGADRTPGTAKTAFFWPENCGAGPELYMENPKTIAVSYPKTRAVAWHKTADTARDLRYFSVDTGTSQHRMARHDQSRGACVAWRLLVQPTVMAPYHPIRVARLGSGLKAMKAPSAFRS